MVHSLAFQALQGWVQELVVLDTRADVGSEGIRSGSGSFLGTASGGGGTALSGPWRGVEMLCSVGASCWLWRPGGFSLTEGDFTGNDAAMDPSGLADGGGGAPTSVSRSKRCKWLGSELPAGARDLTHSLVTFRRLARMRNGIPDSFTADRGDLSPGGSTVSL